MRRIATVRPRGIVPPEKTADDERSLETVAIPIASACVAAEGGSGVANASPSVAASSKGEVGLIRVGRFGNDGVNTWAMLGMACAVACGVMTWLDNPMLFRGGPQKSHGAL
jgi:hypothetical protein